MGRAILLALLCLSAAVTSRAAGSFELYILVRSFSPTLCKQEACTTRPVNAFTLHGLWPEYENGGWPQFCKPALFSNTSRGAQGPENTPQMACEWPSFLGSNQGFWDHEWDKHGTCAEPYLGDRAHFFERVLQLNEKYDADVALDAAGIVPDDARTYPLADVKQAVAARYGAQPVLHCFQGAVLELWMCMSMDLEPITCPPHVGQRSSCGPHVRLPQGDPISPSCSSFFPHAHSSEAGGGGWQLTRVGAGAAVVAAAVILCAALFLLAPRQPRCGEEGYASLA